MACTASPHPAAFTRTQVLGVMALFFLGVLSIGLFLPSLSRVRTAAKRMKCQNQLKLIGLALHNYADVHGALPAATVPHSELPPEQRLSWLVELLPYLEQEHIYRQVDRQLGWQANQGPTQGQLAVLHCREMDRTVPSPWPGQTHYLGAAGVGTDAPELPEKHARAGVFGHARRVAPGQIPDGAENTLLVIESEQNNGPWAQGGHATVRGFNPNNLPYHGPGRQFGGLHFDEPRFLVGRVNYGGCNMALVDVSVRCLRPDTPPAVLQALMTLSGGEELPRDW